MCELCEVERCSGACVLFDYEDHTVCRILYVIIFNIFTIFDLLQRKVKAADEDENDDNNKASKKKKGKPKKKNKKK